MHTILRNLSIILLICVILFVCDRAIGYLLKPHFEHGASELKGLFDQDINATSSPNILFLGDSHTYDGIDTIQLEKACACSVHNAAFGGGEMVSMDMVLNHYLVDLGDSRPKLVVLQVSESNLRKPGDENLYKLFLLDHSSAEYQWRYFWRTGDFDFLARKISWTLRYRLGIKGFLFGDRPTVTTFSTATYDPNDQLTQVHKKNAGNIEISSFELKYAEDILERLHKAHVPVILFEPPEAEVWFGSFKKKDNLSNAINSLSSKYSVPFINLNTQDDVLTTEPNNFQDGEHLNVSGSEKATNLLFQKIKIDYPKMYKNIKTSFY